ncbi:chaperone modulator CbpM [Maribacter sp. X9]|uniref:chaperone modulator CbpM n=1 Tax=Maribacter sp. X9 TaxID=3402159 RepID=UPI003AF3D55D
MQTENFILISHYCQHTQIPVDFIYTLQEYGFIETKQIENKVYVESHAIIEIERIARLQNELGINLEGIDALYNMMHRVNQLELQLRRTTERLKIYEP